MNDNHDFRLPSGAMCTRQNLHRREYYIWTGNGPLARLTVEDVEALYADSIAGDGGRELPERCGARHCCNPSCAARCEREPGHHRLHGFAGMEWPQ